MHPLCTALTECGALQHPRQTSKCMQSTASWGSLCHTFPLQPLQAPWASATPLRQCRDQHLALMSSRWQSSLQRCVCCCRGQAFRPRQSNRCSKTRCHSPPGAALDLPSPAGPAACCSMAVCCPRLHGRSRGRRLQRSRCPSSASWPHSSCPCRWHGSSASCPLSEVRGCPQLR